MKNVLHQAFKIKDLDTLKYFLRLEVSHLKKGITICQKIYCLDLLTDSGFLGSKPVNAPSDPVIKFCHDDNSAFEDIPAYRRLIEILIYLNTTRPDIIFITQQLSQFSSKPSIVLYNATCRVLLYLKICPGRGLLFLINSAIHLSGFSNADWAECLDTKISVSCSCFR